jgi:CheY-like chemotaxis protein
MESTSAYDLNALHVLIVDASQNMRRLVRTMLMGLKVTKIREATDTTAALEEIHHFPADIVIMSYYVEPLSAADFAHALRTADGTPNPYIPIILLTGNTETRVIAEARDSGVNSILATPTSPAAIYKRVVELIEKPRKFITSETYFGPCRRRRSLGPPRGVAERRAA